MKAVFIFLAALFIGLMGCKKKEEVESTPETEATTKTTIPFTGIWERKFETRPGNFQTAKYAVYQDSIGYTLSGAVGNADYVMLRDTFLLEKNRFIGHTSTNQSYLIFVKNISNDSITLYKEEVANITAGLNANFPSDTTTQNHGWNTYGKK